MVSFECTLFTQTFEKAGSRVDISWPVKFDVQFRFVFFVFLVQLMVPDYRAVLIERRHVLNHHNVAVLNCAVGVAFSAINTRFKKKPVGDNPRVIHVIGSS